MTQRSAFQIQILEKLGAPLVSAVGHVSAQTAGDEQGSQQDAGRVAELLNKAVSISIGLANTMDVRGADSEADATRLALAAIAGALISEQYRQTKKVPGDNDTKRLTNALEAVLTFSDSFVPSDENTIRLENIEPGSVVLDENQANIQYVSTLSPVVNIVALYAFGRPESKLAQDISGRLIKKTKQISHEILAGLTEQQVKSAELSILSAFVQLYVECHRAEMDKILNLDDQARAKAAEAGGGMLSMDPVWESFEFRASMVDALARQICPPAAGGESQVSQAPVVSAQEMPPAPVTEHPVQQAPLAQEEPAMPPVQEEVSQPPPAMPAEPPVDQAVPPSPVTQAQEPPSHVPAAAPAEQGEVQEEKGFNPMGFFKPKETDEQTETNSGEGA